MDTGLSDHRAHNRPMDSQALRVYWRPGCSSCVKVKEFLSQLGVDYQSINVSATPEAMDELREMGVRTVPVVARGREYVFAQALEDVPRFVGAGANTYSRPRATTGTVRVRVRASARGRVALPRPGPADEASGACSAGAEVAAGPRRGAAPRRAATRRDAGRARHPGTRPQHPRPGVSRLPGAGRLPAGGRKRRRGPDRSLQRAAAGAGEDRRADPRVRRGRCRAHAALVGRATRQVVPANGEDLLRRATAARAARALHLALGAARAADHRRARGLRHPAQRPADRKGLLRLADA